MSKRTHDDRKKTEDTASVFKIPKKEMMVTRGRTIKMRRQLRIKDSTPNKECATQKSPSPKSPTKVKSPSSKGKAAEKSKLQCKIILKPPQRMLRIKAGMKNKRKSTCPQKLQDDTPAKQTNIKGTEKTSKEGKGFPQVKEISNKLDPGVQQVRKKTNEKNTGLPHAKENANKEETGFLGFRQESSKEPGTKRSLKQRCLEDERIKDRSLAEVIHLREFTEELTDDDLLEIVQCPSPVWWEESFCDRNNRDPVVLPPIEKKTPPLVKKEKTPESICAVRLQPVNVAQIHDGTNMKEYLSKRTVLENVLTSLKAKANDTRHNSLNQQHESSAHPSDSSNIKKSAKSSNSGSMDTEKYQKSTLGSSECIDVNKTIVLPIKNDFSDTKNTKQSAVQSVESSSNETIQKSSTQQNYVEKPKDVVTLDPNQSNPLPKLEQIGGRQSLLIANQTSNLTFKSVLTPTGEGNELLIKKMHAHLPKIKGVTANCMKFIKIIPQGPQAQGKKVYSGNDSAELIPNKVNQANLFDVIDLSDEPEKEIAGPSEIITINSPVKENDAEKFTQENASEVDTVELIEDDVIKDLENLQIPINTLTQECIIIDEDEGNTQNEKPVPFLDQREPSVAPLLIKKLEEQDMTSDTVIQNQFEKDCDDSKFELSVNADNGKRVKRKHDEDSDMSKQPKKNFSENMHTPANVVNSYVAPIKSTNLDLAKSSYLQPISGNINPYNEAKICERLLPNEFENTIKAALDKNNLNSKFSAPSNEQDKTLDHKTADTSKYNKTDTKIQNDETSVKSKSVMSRIKQVYQELISRRDIRKSVSSLSSEQSTTELATEEKSSAELLARETNNFHKPERELTNSTKLSTENLSTQQELSPNLNQDDLKNNNLNEPGKQTEKILQQETQEVVFILNNRDETEANYDNVSSTVHFESTDGPIMYEVVTSDIEILESLNESKITFESTTPNEPLSNGLTPDKEKSEIFSEVDRELNNVTYYELESEEEPEYENINRIPMTKEMIDNIIGIQNTKAVTSGPEALEQIVLHGVNPIAASKKNIVIAKKENVKYCFKCSSIYDTDECCYCQKQKNQPLAVIEKYSCDLCMYKTKKRFLFKKHAMMHTNEGYCCDSCKSMFKSKACLRIHISKLCRVLAKKKDSIKMDAAMEVQSNRLDSKKLQKQILDETSGYIVILTES